MSGFNVYVLRPAWKEIKELPGNMRQRVKRAVEALADDPRPPKSKRLATQGIEQEVCRLRMEKWRIVYAIDERDHSIDVLAVRQRPPYDYGDLEQLLRGTK